MMKEMTEKQSGKAMSFGVGFLMMHALPASAVSAGWTLSASLGTQTGEFMAAVIFSLGCAVMLVAHQTGDRRICSIIRVLTAIIYAVVSAGSVNSTASLIIASADVLLSVLLMTGRWINRYSLIAVGAVSLFLPVTANIWGRSFEVNMLLPLSAALAAGAAVSDISSAQSLSGTHAVAGMTTALLIDILR